MLKRWLARFLEVDPDPRLLDHVPVEAPALPELHRSKLMDAAAKFGRPFKCAARDMDREVMIVPGDVRPVKAGRAPTTKAEVPDGEKEYGAWGVGLVADLSELPVDVARNVRSLRAAGRP